MPIPPQTLERAFGDRFEIERELGQGGMAVVYLAHDREEDRRVALKVLLPELSSSVGSDRFLKEIEIGRRLTHTHILPLYRSGQAEGLLYYTMQYVEGETLRESLERERQLPIQDALDVARDVASALDYAHRQGVVHRDIKPSNIMLSPGGAIVMDFGIARALDEAGGERLTRTGLSMGTPAYMSPEQADGRVYLDGRADQYSLACVLYEMLAGHPPFQGHSTQAILNRHARDPVPPLASARSSVPPPIEAVVHKALSKVPADRFRTAARFSIALDMAEQGVTPRWVTPAGVTPVAGPRPRPGSFLEELKRRRVYQVATAYAVVAFLLVQVLDAVVEPLGVPRAIHTGAIWAAIAGFPIALLLAWWYELTPGGLRKTRTLATTPGRARVAPSRRRWLALGVVLVAIAGLALWIGGGSPSTRSVDLDAVTPFDLETREFVVLPFRVSGAEPELSTRIPELLDGFLHGARSDRDWDVTDVIRLREGEAGDPGEISRTEAFAVAARLGAGRIVRAGSVVGSSDHLTIRATVERVPTGTILAQEQVLGSAADLEGLARRLAVLLLNHGWEDAVSRQELERVSPAALDAYLTGVRARWRGDSTAAREAAVQAGQREPEFAAAAFLEWVSRPTEEAERRAWALRDRLAERARTRLLVASAGRGPGYVPTAREEIEYLEQRHLEYPTYGELIERLARLQHELGAYAGRPGGRVRIENLLDRHHEVVEGEEGVEIAWRVRSSGWDPAPSALADLVPRVAVRAMRDTVGGSRFLAFEVAAVLEDREELDRLRSRDIHRLDPSRFLRFGLLEARPRDDPLADYERAIQVARDAQITSRDRVWASHHSFRLAEARGHIERAAALADTMSRVGSRDVHADARGDPWWYLTRPIAHALYEPGWREPAARALGALESRDYVPAEHPWYGEVEGECWSALGNIALGRLAAAAARVEPLREAVEGSPDVRGVCLAAVEALIEHGRSPAGTAPKLAAFAALVRPGPQETLMGLANLLLAQIHLERGEEAAALAAVSRRPFRREVFSSLPGYLRLEGRLAAAAGEVERARELYRHYLLLRSEPDSALVPQRDSVRAELDGLAGDPGRTDRS